MITVVDNYKKRSFYLKIKSPGLNKRYLGQFPKQHWVNDKINLKLQQLFLTAAINTAKNADIFVKTLRITERMRGWTSPYLFPRDSLSEIRYDEDPLHGRSSDYLFHNDLNETINRHWKIALQVCKENISYPKQRMLGNKVFITRWISIVPEATGATSKPTVLTV